MQIDVSTGTSNIHCNGSKRVRSICVLEMLGGEEGRGGGLVRRLVAGGLGAAVGDRLEVGEEPVLV